MEKIQTIISKEWAEVFKNRLVLFTVAFLPLILTALPLIMLAVTGGADMSADLGELPGEAAGELACAGLTDSECVQVYTLNTFTLLFMILPVAIPVTIAAYSIVGEKTSRSLEPLLATPITTVELLLGKAIAAVTPAVVATYAAFAIYLVGVWLMASPAVLAAQLQPVWLLAILVVGPLLALTAVSVAVMISSRVTDPRAAEQLSALLVVPVIMLILSQSFGLFLINQRLIIFFGIGVAVLDVMLFYLSVRVFQREMILTRWK